MDFDQFMRSSSSGVKTGAGPRRGALFTRLPMQHGEVRGCGEHTQKSLSLQYYLQISHCCDF